MITFLKTINKDVLKFLFIAGLFLVGTLSYVLADTPPVPAGGDPVAAAGGGSAPQPPGIGGMLVPFILMFVVIYFLMIRPQQKRMKQHQEMISSLKHGDDVVTASGILGKITGIAEKVVTVEVADDVKIKVLKNQVSQVVKGQVKDLA